MPARDVPSYVANHGGGFPRGTPVARKPKPKVGPSGSGRAATCNPKDVTQCAMVAAIEATPSRSGVAGEGKAVQVTRAAGLMK